MGYMDRVPLLILLAPAFTGIPLEKLSWMIPAIQIVLSCYTLVVVNKYARRFIPGISIIEYLSRDSRLAAPGVMKRRCYRIWPSSACLWRPRMIEAELRRVSEA